ncbi:cell division trigger factor [hydrocarbon metagenome]|uniref:peptidylprolyl isomerase n=1 Tax=hydrocarbon metagenome TaxID=938273 RepID=A0A0W8FM93_9ZZZZ
MSQVVVKIEELSPVKKKMSLEIPWDEVKNELDAAYHDVGKKARLKGFRPGKIPRKVLETYFKDQAEGETTTNIVNKYYWQTLEEKGIVALSRPEINQEGIKENTNFSFTASFEIEPEFEPKNYKGLDLEKEEVRITDDDVQKRIDEIRHMFATMEEVKEDRAAVMGDFVVIDFEGTLNGEAYKELKAENYFLEIGSGKFVPGFEEQLIGIKKEDKKEIRVTFPADYHESKFAGQEVVFNVTVKNIREKKLPENDDNLIKNFERYNNFEDFKNDVRTSLEEKNQQTGKVDLQNSITEKLIKDNDFEVPPSLVERQIYYMMADTQRRMMSAGIDEEQAMEFSMKMHDKFKDDAEKIVKSFLLLKKIAQKESLTVEEPDIEKYLQDLAVQHKRDYESLKKMYEEEERRDNLKMEIMQKKVFDFIEQNANIKTVEKKDADMEVK